ncbi:DEAD-domain-containing protein [Basidiobolus meristosporus CBS 931.73]|uniref:ATP-dependent RNA helicase DRS1 n=1 Tax=Basidiobolus meristosporus CBS 931.73 TaxID=1314790 RepID=A0A1Y1YXW5_9FUNG|nr:DEAD-domain-containing protein [Basidiobolus meristosporus CBS 931.73]ORY02776.1 DEAD-domain-containing protein [Basidiobolus meristosporus CBS 931.73]|eukprot:ORX63764.1 DEAD-domain-containing protein [Basidiobolus meristosporus CBS 931.73]
MYWLNPDSEDDGLDADSSFFMDEDDDEEEEDVQEEDEEEVEMDEEEDAEESNDDEEDSEEEEEEEEIEEEEADDSESEDEYEKRRKAAYFAAPEETTSDVPESFAGMNLSRPIMKGLSNIGFVKPTPIQAKTIPIALLGKDICGGAVTGSGKTGAFIVPILERLLYRPRQNAAIRVLILCPTRELAIQCHSVGTKLAQFTDIDFCLCIGGLSLKVQEMALKQRPDVVIATPGRLIDHIHNSPSFTLDQIEILIMDEADRMLEDGFTAELTEIVKNCPKSRQTMLFSATMTDNVDELIRLSLNKPVRLMIDSPKSTADNLIQEFVRVRQHREADRSAMLASLCKKYFKKKCIIFFRSKASAHQMKIIFGLLGLRAAELHGNLTQEQRLEALEQFRDEKVDYLLATDLASRGLDIKGIETVINFNMPTSFAQYQHRVGRTARAGRSGRSVTLVGEADRKMLRLAIKHSSKEKIKNRVLGQELVQKYKEKIDGLTEQVKEIMKEEKDEKMFRQAEMEVTKAQNLIDHEKEIYSRPARTWFQSEKERQKSKDVALASHNAKFEPKKVPNSKKRRMKSSEDVQVENQQKRSIRAAKKALQPKKINTVIERNASAAGPAKKKQKKNRSFASDLADGSKRNAGPKLTSKNKKGRK